MGLFNVPQYLGLSSIGVNPNFASTVLVGAATNALQTYLVASASTQWGVFNMDGSPLLACAHARYVDSKEESAVTDAPLQKGSFSSYNKQSMPFTSRVILVTDGDNASYLPTLGFLSDPLSQRAKLTKILSSLVKSTKLVAVATPEKTFVNANLLSVVYIRESRRNVGKLEAELVLQEIRTTGQAGFTGASTVSPQGSATQYSGSIQAVNETVVTT